MFPRYAGTFTVALVAVIFCCVGGILLTVFAWGVPTDYRIEHSLARVEATIERVSVDPNRRKNRIPMTRLEYRYVFEGREFRDDFYTIDERFIAERRAGATTTVELNRTNPREARLEGTRVALFGTWGLLLGFFPLLGVGLFGYSFVIFLEERRR